MGAPPQPTIPDWYQDPAGRFTHQAYWDGERWTGEVRTGSTVPRTFAVGLAVIFGALSLLIVSGMSGAAGDNSLIWAGLVAFALLVLGIVILIRALIGAISTATRKRKPIDSDSTLGIPSDPEPMPGYYSDIGDPAIERWWDGSGWTEVVRPNSPLPRWQPWRIANFRSRARRCEFWAAYGLAVSLLALMGLVPTWARLIVAGLAAWLIAGSTVNRLHDLGKRGPFSAIFLMPLANLIAFIWVGITHGQPKSNWWGPPIS